MEPIETMNHEGGLQEGGEGIIHTASVLTGNESVYLAGVILKYRVSESSPVCFCGVCFLRIGGDSYK